ncbi:hypothetical protein TUM17576_49960 [Enterobacter hormaechei]|nr:hypothetical protein MRY16398_51430 [Phytobacter sp. MRY16-398]GJL38176.1 hypothetical protein TUM17576_49960 [Enterobacter hormaechei]GJL43649.1 hypothetical protein TUM17577_48580 [Enterobacter asburiae]
MSAEFPGSLRPSGFSNILCRCHVNNAEISQALCNHAGVFKLAHTYGTIYAFFSEVNVTIRYAEFNFYCRVEPGK